MTLEPDVLAVPDGESGGCQVVGDGEGQVVGDGEDRVAVAWSALHSVPDPCSLVSGNPIDIVELGLVRYIRALGNQNVVIVISPTSPACMSLPIIAALATEAVESAVGAGAVHVEIDHDFVWTSAAMSAPARKAKHERETEKVVALQITPAALRAPRTDTDDQRLPSPAAEGTML